MNNNECGFIFHTHTQHQSILNFISPELILFFLEKKMKKNEYH